MIRINFELHTYVLQTLVHVLRIICRKIVPMKFAISNGLAETKNHSTDCYFCLTKTQGYDQKTKNLTFIFHPVHVLLSYFPCLSFFQFLHIVSISPKFNFCQLFSDCFFSLCFLILFQGTFCCNSFKNKLSKFLLINAKI